MFEFIGKQRDEFNVMVGLGIRPTCTRRSQSLDTGSFGRGITTQVSLEAAGAAGAGAEISSRGREI